MFVACYFEKLALWLIGIYVVIISVMLGVHYLYTFALKIELVFE